MELVWLEDFIALAEHGSFVRAAEARHITQPAFSRRIRALEEWMGVTLFARTPQGTSLTQAGRAMHEDAVESVRRLYRLREDVQRVAGKAVDTVQFAATHSLSFTFFPRWIRQIEQGAPIEALQLHTESMAACERLLMQGQVHFLLSHQHPDVPPSWNPGQCQTLAVGEDELVPVVGSRLIESPASRWPRLIYTEESGLGRIVARRASWGDEPGPVAFSSHLAAVLLSMAREGKGMAWLPRLLVETDLQEGRLQPVAGLAPIGLEVHLTRPRSRLTPFAEALWDRLAASR